MKTFKFSYENLSNKNGQVWLVSNCNDSFSMDYLINGILPNFKTIKISGPISAAGLTFWKFSETKFYSEYYTILVFNVVHTYFISKNGNVLCSLSEFELKHAQYDQNLLTRHFLLSTVGSVKMHFTQKCSNAEKIKIVLTKK